MEVEGIEGDQRRLTCWNLPLGYRFRPNEDEIFRDYLMPRLYWAPFPHGVIAELDIYQFKPCDLARHAFYNGTENLFFFTQRRSKNGNGIMIERTTIEGGFWKMTSKYIEIKGQDGGVWGRKNTLVYYSDKNRKTNWIMHEYVLHPTLFPQSLDGEKTEDVVLCKIYHRREEEPDN